MRSTQTASLFLGALLIAASATADVRYQSETQVKFSGALGTMMKLFGGSKPNVSTVSLKGNLLRTDSEENSQIIDLDRGVFIDLDHKKKQYTELTFEAMRQRMQAAAEKLQQHSASEPTGTPASPQIHFKAAVQRTGNKQTLDGHDTESVLLTLTLEGQDSTGATGSMVTTSEMWMAKDLPGDADMQAFTQHLAAKFGKDVLGGGKFLDVLATSSPEMAAAMRELQKQAHDVKGTPLLTTTRIDGAATPAPGAEGGAAKAEPAAKDEGIKLEKPSIGGMLGHFGKKKLEEHQKNKEAAQAADGGRANLLTSSTRLSGYSTATLGGEIFEIPATYKKVEPKD
jgi:hypothetical protein